MLRSVRLFLRYCVTVVGAVTGIVVAPVFLSLCVTLATVFFAVNVPLAFWWAVVNHEFGWRAKVLLVPTAWFGAVTLYLCELIAFVLFAFALVLVQPIAQPPSSEGIFFLGPEVIRVGVGMVRSVWRNHMELANVLQVRRHGAGAHRDLPHIGHLPVVAVASPALGVVAGVATAVLLLAKVALLPLAKPKSSLPVAVAVFGIASAVVLADGDYDLSAADPPLQQIAQAAALWAVWPATAIAAVLITPFCVVAAGYACITPFRSLALHHRWQVAGWLVADWLRTLDHEASHLLGVPHVLRNSWMQLPRRPGNVWQPVVTNVAASFYSQREAALDPSPEGAAPLGDALRAWDLLDAVLWAHLDQAMSEGMLAPEIVERFKLDDPNPFNPVARAVAALAVSDAALRSMHGGAPTVQHPWVLLARAEGGRHVLRTVVGTPKGVQGKAFRAAGRTASAVLEGAPRTHEERVWLRWWLCGWEAQAGWYHNDAEESLNRRLAAAGLTVPSADRLRTLCATGRTVLREIENSGTLSARGAWWSGPQAKTERRRWNELLQLSSAEHPALHGVPMPVGDLSRMSPRVLLASAPYPSARGARPDAMHSTTPRCLTPDMRSWSEQVAGAGRRAEKFMHSTQPSYPARQCNAKVLIDGAEFMAEARRLIEGAKREVMISSWKLCPWFGMGRAEAGKQSDWNAAKAREQSRGCDHQQGREVGFDVQQGETLRDLLVRKAREGVKVYVLLFQSHRRIMGQHFSDEAAGELWAANEMLRREGAAGCIMTMRHPPPLSAANAGLTEPLLADCGAAPRFALSHHQKFFVVDREHAVVGGLDFCIGRFDTQQHLISDVERRVWPAQDFYNPAVGVAPVFGEELWRNHQWIDSRREVRLPWHDTTVLVDGCAAADCADVFVNRWNHHSNEPGCSDPVGAIEQSPSVPPQPPQQHVGKQRAQVLLSLAPWCGSGHVEMSVYGAHVAAIQAAKYHVYLENQYVASSCDAGCPDSNPQNLVFAALLQRLREARKKGAEDPFLATLVLTLPEESDETAQGIIKWLLVSVSRGEHSLFAALRADGWTPDEIHARVSAVFLRSHAVLPPWPHGADPPLGMEPHVPPVLPTDGPYSWRARDEALRSGKHVAVHAMVFVHSKLLIVDDKLLLCGSANLNDRSLVGRRDSELCLLCSDDDLVETTMRGEKVQVGRMAHETRVRLMEEHAGLLWSSDVTPYRHGSRSSVFADPLCAEAQQLWDKQADTNAVVYQAVFPGGAPSSKIGLISEFIAHPWRLVDDEVEFSHEAAWRLSTQGVTVPHNRRLTVGAALRLVSGHLYRFPFGLFDGDRLAPPLIDAVSRVNGFDITQ
eukprot:TRINITY_DN43195_c0_g1_i1.p1 TRINITY_DN43195_c0_g1~~TRINITY_DN43195_c0_g1_i1.p1  ORF type:complete len:1341 (+),score=440.22 TRINITY_DN43195_c0_g1_i1:70-4092(+)